MLLPYDEQQKTYIEESVNDLTKKTGYSEEKLYGLSGIYGYTNYKNLKDFKSASIYGSYPIIEIEVLSKTVILKVIIDIENLLIDNVFVCVHPQKHGHGLAILRSQIFYCTMAGIKVMTGIAQKENGIFGYIVWGKLGYTMQIYDEARYTKLLIEKKDVAIELASLIEEDFSFWEKFGFSWSAFFSLDYSSYNNKILSDYTYRKGQKIIKQIDNLKKKESQMGAERYKVRLLNLYNELDKLLLHFYPA